MGFIGNWSLLLSLICIPYMIISNFYGGRSGKIAWIRSGRRAALAVVFLSTLALLSLIYLLVIGDFRYEYVADYTSRDLGVLYRIAAFWGGNQGSLLLWFWVLTLYTTMVTFSRFEGRNQFQPYVTSILG